MGKHCGKTLPCLEKAELDEESGFGGLGWYRSIETAYEEEVECGLEAAPLIEGAGVVESNGGKSNHLGVFM